MHMNKNKNSIANAEAKKIIAEYPRKELFVSCLQVARDMSVGISNTLKAIIPFEEIRQGERIDFPYVILKALQVDDDHLTLEWTDHDHYICELQLGQEAKIETGNNASSLTPTTKWLNLSFKYMTLEDKMFEIFQKIADYHNGLSNDFQSQIQHTAHDEAIVLRLIDELIKQGDVELYLFKAILFASNNWYTGEIVRPSVFRHIFLKGIDHGCLAPECHNAWDWLKVAAINNNPMEFMDDMDRFYDILATAVEVGNETAREIMDMIWEPEQIMEED